MSRSLSALRSTTDEELIAEHDEKARHTSVGIDYYLTELERRSRERSTLASQKLAVRAFWLSIANMLVALVAVAIALLR